MKPCSVAACSKPAKAKGMCGAHHMRWTRYGDPLHVPERIPHRPLIPVGQRFWSRVDFSDPDGCWLWTGSRRHSYGEIYVDGQKVYAHRAAYELASGRELMEGEVVAHICDTPLCVRPDHLVATTQAANCRDMAAKGRWRNQYAAGENAGEDAVEAAS